MTDRSMTARFDLALFLAFLVLTACSSSRSPASVPDEPLLRLLEKGERGEPAAAHNLCHAFFFGQRAPQDDAAAFLWCSRAAANGDPSSQVLLADLYAEGRAVRRDERAAFDLYRSAAESGHPRAEFMLGRMYEAGRGVERDPVEAKRWIERAASQGYTDESRPPRSLSPEQLAQGNPCKYQGTFHRMLRAEIEACLSQDEITEEQWLCQKRALEQMDLKLRTACRTDPDAVERAIEAQRSAFSSCLE